MGSRAQLRLLLDTHIWLWSLLEPARLRPRIAQALEDGANQLWLSPISVWEALLLAERGRLRMQGDPTAWVGHALDAFAVRDATLTREVALASRSLDLAHEDPADRFIAASAIVYDLVLVTADERLLESGRYQVLPSR